MNIEICKEDDYLLLCYYPSKNEAWINEHFENGEVVRLKCDMTNVGTFVFEQSDLVRTEPIQTEVDQYWTGESVLEHNHVWYFKLGVHEDNGYYRISAKVLSSRHDVLIHESVDVKMDFFVASVLNTRIVPIIDKMINTCLVIGGDAENAIPIDVYKEIIKKLPSREELHLYAQSRIEGILTEYVPDVRESSIELSEYMKRRYKRVKSRLDNVRGNIDSAVTCLKEIDCTRIKFTLKRLKELLGNVGKFTEQQWQAEIEKIILLLFPWFIAKISQLCIAESLGGANNRRIDLALVSMSGNVDIVEIKRPDNCQLLSRKSNYRGNYIPSRDLSAAVMQAEKYLENLERWGRSGERKIAERINMKNVRIRRPKAIIIIGRNIELDNEQKRSDFEIIKRKFANVVDVVTYDDLMERLQNVLDQLENE